MENKYEKGIFVLSFIFFFSSIYYIVIIKGYFPKPPFMVPLSQDINTLIGFSLLLIILPFASMQLIQDNWLENVDRNVPRLLQDVTEDVKSGQSLIKALEQNAQEDYGSITNPLQRALAQFKFTSDLAASMNWLGNNLRRPTAKQMTAIFIEAYEAGGRVNEILHNSVRLFKSIDENRINRNIKTRPYVLVVYVSLGIFLIISSVLLNKFLIPMNVTTQTITNFAHGFNLDLLPVEYYRSILFWTAIAESIFGGLIAGKISKGKTSSGLIHSTIMLSATIFFFNLFI